MKPTTTNSIDPQRQPEPASLPNLWTPPPGGYVL